MFGVLFGWLACVRWFVDWLLLLVLWCWLALFGYLVVWVLFIDWLAGVCLCR